MDAIFMNSGNSKTSDLHRLNFSDKVILNTSDKYIASSNVSIFYT